MGFVSVVLVWLIVYDLGLVSRLVLPSPLQVALALVEWSKSSLFIDLQYTILRIFSSVTTGSIMGIMVGTSIAGSDTLRKIFMPLIDAFRSIPAIALFPLFTIVFGIGELSKIASVTFGVFFLIVIYTVQGIVSVNRTLLLFPKTVSEDLTKTNKWILANVLIPGALPTILFGIRISIPLALVVTVATEMFFNTRFGLGSRIITSQLAYRVPEAWAAIIVTSFLGYAFNSLASKVERYYGFWVSK